MLFRSPSKLQATIRAVKEQYPSRRLIACMELHTFSSLNAAFLPQYAHSMDAADEAIVYFNPEVVRHKRLPEITVTDVQRGFANDRVKVYTDNAPLLAQIEAEDLRDTVLLVMTSGNFSGIDLKKWAQSLTESK